MHESGQELGQEPDFKTDPELAGVLQELIAREPIGHRPEWGTTRADFDNMLSEEFWETGASGARYSRQFALDTLERRFAAPYEDVWEASGFYCQRLASDVCLVTYTLVQNRSRKSRRATIWRRAANGWKVVYHQGTLIQEP